MSGKKPRLPTSDSPPMTVPTNLRGQPDLIRQRPLFAPRPPSPPPQAAASLSVSDALSRCSNVSESFTEFSRKAKEATKKYGKERDDAIKKLENIHFEYTVGKLEHQTEVTFKRELIAREKQYMDLEHRLQIIIRRESDKIKKTKVTMEEKKAQLAAIVSQLGQVSELVRQRPGGHELDKLERRLDLLDDAYRAGEYYTTEQIDEDQDGPVRMDKPIPTQTDTTRQKVAKALEGVSNALGNIFQGLGALITAIDECATNTTYPMYGDDSQSTINSSVLGPVAASPASSRSSSSPSSRSSSSPASSRSSSSSSSSPSSKSSSSPSSRSSSSPESPDVLIPAPPAGPINGKRGRSRSRSPTGSPKNKTARVSSAMRKLQSAFRSRQSRKNSAATRLQATWRGTKTRNGTRRSPTPKP